MNLIFVQIQNQEASLFLFAIWLNLWFGWIAGNPSLDQTLVQEKKNCHAVRTMIVIESTLRTYKSCFIDIMIFRKRRIWGLCVAKSIAIQRVCGGRKTRFSAYKTNSLGV